jgi:hypothetical protein
MSMMDLGKRNYLIRVLLKSRRAWQVQSLEARAQIRGLGDDKRYLQAEAKEWHDRLEDAEHVIRTLWKSRRKWQEEAKKWHRFFVAESRIGERQEARLAKVRELHPKSSFVDGKPEWCDGENCLDTSDWPCETIRILDGTDSPDDKGSTSTAKG